MIELREHNRKAVKELREVLKSSQHVCTMRATGTGKSYIIAELSKDYKKVLIMAPSTFILEQQKRLIGERKGIEYVTYQKTITKDYRVPTNLNAIFLDEFHRVGAEHWGEMVNRIIMGNPKAKVIGFTATTIRGLEGRDMAMEVFDGNVISPLSLPEAWVDGILKLPVYVSSFYEIDKIVEEEKKKARMCKEAIDRLGKLAIDWKKSGGIPSIIMDYLPKDSKRVIVFLSNIAELKRMRKVIEGWFVLAGFKETKFYEIHQRKSNPEKELARFMEGDSSKLKVILSVNMLNEGLHVPDVDSVIFLRKTESNIIFLQQLGRCLTVDHKKAPIVFDLVGNIESSCISSIHEINEEMEKIQKERGVKEDRRVRLEIKGTLLDMVSILKSIRDLYITDYREKLQEMIKSGDFSEVKNGNKVYNIVQVHKRGGKGENWPEADICWTNRPDAVTNPNLIKCRELIKKNDFSEVKPSNKKFYDWVCKHRIGGLAVEQWSEADTCWKNRPAAIINPYLIKCREIIKSGDYSEVRRGTDLYLAVLYHKKGGDCKYWPEADVCWKNRPGAKNPFLIRCQEMIETGDYSEVRRGTDIYNAIKNHKEGGICEHWEEADTCWENRKKRKY